MEVETLRLLTGGRMEQEKNMATQVAPPAYLKLIRRYPLRPIRSDEELDRAIAMVDALGSRIKDLTPDERDYLDVLADLVEKYETERYPEPEVDPLAMIRELIAARGITQADVARETGIAESMLSEILKGKRRWAARRSRRFPASSMSIPACSSPMGSRPRLGRPPGRRGSCPSLKSPGRRVASAADLPQSGTSASISPKGPRGATAGVEPKKPPKNRED